jgi:predicted nucleic acid-binding protein
MCFVLDTNTFHRVFNRDCKEHVDFSPLLEWLYNHPRTSLVIGGKAYRREIGRLSKYLTYLVELKRARKLSEIDDSVVDAEEDRLRDLVTHRNFDDPHIVALFCASGCLLFASHDKRADPFLKMKALYPKGQKRPRIYRECKHKTLLTDANIVALRNLRK